MSESKFSKQLEQTKDNNDEAINIQEYYQIASQPELNLDHDKNRSHFLSERLLKLKKSIGSGVPHGSMSPQEEVQVNKVDLKIH